MNPSLEKIARILTERRQTVTCAESCTGGLLAGEYCRQLAMVPPKFCNIQQ